MYKSIITTLLIILSPLVGFCQYYSSVVYKNREDMPSNRVTEIAQQANGIIWLITQEGICSYDGLEWNAPVDSLGIIPHLDQTEILPLPDSTFVIAGFTPTEFTITRYQNKEFTAIELPKSIKSIPNKSLYALVYNESSRQLILGLRNELIFIDDDTFQSKQLDFPDPQTTIQSISGFGDSLFLGTSDGLWLYQNGLLKALFSSDQIVDQLADESNQKVYILTESWLGVYSPKSGLSILRREVMATPGTGRNTNLLLKNGALYYSYNSPIHRYDLETGHVSLVLTENFDVDHTAMSAIFDLEGNLWVATLRGVFKCNSLDIYHYNRSHLLENEVTASYEDKDGIIYLGSNVGLNILYPSGKIEKIPFEQRYLQPRIMDIVEFQGEIYLAANSAGVLKLSNFRLVPQFHQTLSSKTTDLQVFQNKLYVSDGNNLFEKNANSWRLIHSGNLKKYGVIRKIYFNDRYRILLTNQGIFDLDHDVLINSIRSDECNIYCAFEFDGELLLGTALGLRMLKDDKILPSEKLKIEVNQPVYGMCASLDGKSLWIGTGSGAFLITHDEIFQLSKKNGLAGNEVNRNAFSFLSNGKLGIGTDEGFSVFDPQAVKLKRPVPSVEISEIIVNGESITDLSNLESPVDEVTFMYRSISFYNEARINYRTRLLGYDSSWHNEPFNNHRSITFRNLDEGEYQFQVQARVADGQWSDVSTSEIFRITGRVYEQLWFQLTCLILVSALILGIIRIRNIQLKKQNERLEKMVKEKTRELNDRNIELLRTIKDLKSAQGQLIQSEKLASMGHLTAGIAHELNNPLNYIRGGASCIINNLIEIQQIMESTGTSLEPNLAYLMTESKTLAESILIGSNKSTDIVKSLSSFTADAQHFYSFTDIEKEVETALTLLGNQIGFRITINRLFGNVPPIECFPAKINQLIVNLLLNAVQAIEKTGEITIRIFRRDSQYVCLEISDNGSGISSENLEKVFEPFYTTKDTNSGLGLTISEAIVQEHHGQIKIRSRLHQGTKVSVTLPVNQDQPQGIQNQLEITELIN